MIHGFPRPLVTRRSDSKNSFSALEIANRWSHPKIQTNWSLDYQPRSSPSASQFLSGGNSTPSSKSVQSSFQQLITRSLGLRPGRWDGFAVAWCTPPQAQVHVCCGCVMWWHIAGIISGYLANLLIRCWYLPNGIRSNWALAEWNSTDLSTSQLRQDSLSHSNFHPDFPEKHFVEARLVWKFVSSNWLFWFHNHPHH